MLALVLLSVFPINPGGEQASDKLLSDLIVIFTVLIEAFRGSMHKGTKPINTMCSSS